MSAATLTPQRSCIMKNTINIFIITILVMVIGLTMFACDSNGDGDASGDTGDSGTFTLTDIPEQFNGTYVFIEAGNDNFFILGASSFNMSAMTVTLPRVSNGSVTVPLWSFTSQTSYKKFSGTASDIGIELGFFANSTCNMDSNGGILNSAIDWIDFYPVIFTKGSATKSYNDRYIE